MNLNVKALFLMTLMAVFIAACGETNNSDNNEERVRLVPVETVTIELHDFDDFIRLTGIVEAIDDAIISAESSGRILSIAERGELIEQGGVIARLDDRLIRAQYSAAKTGFELAEDRLSRMEALYADSIVSTQDYNNARAQRDQAKAQLEQAEKQLQDVQITAPFSGRVEERMIRTGELINPGMPVVRLVNTDRVRILSGVPERYAPDIGVGAEVRLFISALGGEMIESTVGYTGNVIDPDTRTFEIEVEIDNAELNIKPDMVANLQVQRKTMENVIIIPRTAIIRDENGTFVFVVNEENGQKIAGLTEVRTGVASGPLIQIISGLEEGGEIVVNGMRNLSVGDGLNIINTESSISRASKLQTSENPVVSY